MDMEKTEFTGVVLDVIADGSHPIFKGHEFEKEWVGKVLVRPVPPIGGKDQLCWAAPLGCVGFPFLIGRKD